jgi:hypothetical protein
VNAGDLLVLCVGSGVGGGTSSPGVDWERVRTFYDVGNAQVEVFWKIADGTESGTFDVNPAAGVDDNYTTAVVRVTGASTRLPIVAANFTGVNSNGTSRTIPRVKCTRAGQMALTFMIGGWSASTPYTWTFPSGWTEAADLQSTTIGSGGNVMGIGYRTNTVAGKTYGGDAATLSTALTYAGFTLMIEGDTP